MAHQCTRSILQTDRPAGRFSASEGHISQWFDPSYQALCCSQMEWKQTEHKVGKILTPLKQQSSIDILTGEILTSVKIQYEYLYKNREKKKRKKMWVC